MDAPVAISWIVFMRISSGITGAVPGAINLCEKMGGSLKPIPWLQVPKISGIIEFTKYNERPDVHDIPKDYPHARDCRKKWYATVCGTNSVFPAT